MSWQGETIVMVRHLIDDLDPTNYTYSNDRIETALLVSAQIVQSEVDFEQVYTISVEECSISPDPISPRDDAFLNLAALKTAALIMMSEFKTHSLSAISVTDGPSTINFTAVAGFIKTLYENAQKGYEKYKFNYLSGAASLGKAILSPYSPGSDAISHNFRSR